MLDSVDHLKLFFHLNLDATLLFLYFIPLFVYFTLVLLDSNLTRMKDTIASFFPVVHAYSFMAALFCFMVSWLEMRPEFLGSGVMNIFPFLVLAVLVSAV
ncbi:MAG: hypothetical protein HQL32_06685 [Planctomycetes bacterium]|nr:hypothetical protein [Planctomycetota bacterium]